MRSDPAKHALFVVIPAILGFALAALIAAILGVDQFWLGYFILAAGAASGREIRWRAAWAAGGPPPRWYK